MIAALIAAAIAAAIAGGAAGGKDAFEQVAKDWKKALRRDVKDPARRVAAQAVLDKWQAEVARLNELIAHMVHKELCPVHSRYESSVADYQAVVASFSTQLLQIQLAMVELGEELRTTLGTDFQTINEKSRKKHERQLDRWERQERRKEKQARKRADKSKRAHPQPDADTDSTHEPEPAKQP